MVQALKQYYYYFIFCLILLFVFWFIVAYFFLMVFIFKENLSHIDDTAHESSFLFSLSHPA